MARLARSGIAVAALLLATALAAAGPVEEADAAFTRGKEAFKRGDFAGARDAYRVAYQHRPTYYVASNLAQTEAKLQLWIDAATHFAEALRADLPPDLRAQVQAGYDEARTHVVQLVISGSPDGAAVSVDDTDVGKLPLPPVFVPAGAHHVFVLASGFAPENRVLRAREGESVPLRIVLSPLPGGQVEPAASSAPSASAAGGTAPDQPPPVTRWQAPAAWTSAALAAVGLGLWLGFTAQAGGADDDVTRLKGEARRELGGNCPNADATPTCTRLGIAIDDRDAARTRATVSAVGAGVFALGAGVFFLWPRSDDTRRGARRTHVTLTPGGVILGGEF